MSSSARLLGSRSEVLHPQTGSCDSPQAVNNTSGLEGLRGKQYLGGGLVLGGQLRLLTTGLNDDTLGSERVPVQEKLKGLGSEDRGVNAKAH